MPQRDYPGPQSMPSFEEWVLTRPLGRQMLEDPPEVVDKLYAAYERHIQHMISLQGGTKTQKRVYSSEWKEQRLENAERDPAAAASARPNSRTWKYSDVRRAPQHMRPSHGDIPAWAPKVYPTAPDSDQSAESKGEAAGQWPQVSLTGRNTPRPKTTQWAQTERVDLILGGRSRLYNADVRLAVPTRETVGNKGMASRLLSLNRKVDQHGELCGHTGMTPLTAAHRVRAISLPRGGRGM
eukprot:Tamp_13094.p1 GENE.Tamp_13094~~Tamp_13094.p1  ORF type:complete len:239 (+),score=30.97 Tamp_13094:432-1148(+)